MASFSPGAAVIAAACADKEMKRGGMLGAVSAHEFYGGGAEPPPR